MVQSKLPGVGTTIFTHMSALAMEHNALNLSQGFPDFDGPLAYHVAVLRGTDVDQPRNLAKSVTVE